MVVCVCLFPHISVSFACLGLTFCKTVWGPLGWFVHYKNLKKSPWVRILTKELSWTFDTDYGTRCNSSYMYNCLCSELRDLSPHKFIRTVRTLCETEIVSTVAIVISTLDRAEPRALAVVDFSAVQRRVTRLLIHKHNVLSLPHSPCYHYTLETTCYHYLTHRTIIAH